MDKYFYDAIAADQEYRRDLVDYREGIDLTTKERDAIAAIIAPLLKQGQSVYQILSAHPEITKCEKTIYTYITSGVFKGFGVDNFSLKEQVNRKQFKEKYKKRKEKANYEGRRYSDYLLFRSEHPDVLAVEMDLLYNSPEGPYIQTFLFEKTTFMIAFIHKTKACEGMAKSIDFMQSKLGTDLFSRLCSLLLTDRGGEFEMYRLFELDKAGNSRLNMFYCDPMQSNQKSRLENNHNFVRDIIPNGYPLGNLKQADIDLMCSHINATPRRSLGDRSPFETFGFLHGDSVPNRLNIREIQRDEVILKPQLIFTNK
jgi:IS30 family transposase